MDRANPWGYIACVATTTGWHEATRHRPTPLLNEYAENEYAALKTRRNHPTLSGW